MADLEAGNVPSAQAEYQAFNDAWPTVETGVRQQDHDMYRTIEGNMTQVQAAFAAQPPDAARISAALTALDGSIDAFTTKYGSSSTPAGSASGAASPAVDMAGQLADLQAAQTAIASTDAPLAAAHVQDFIHGWPDVEGTVAAKDPGAYSAVENEMAQAYGLLTSNPANYSQASAVIGQMRRQLSPYAQSQVRYSVFDAAIILLREGFEALLVFGALLAFLKRSGNGDKQAWVWTGGGAGLLLSAVIAVVVNVLFSKAGGSMRELLEGVTGLVAAVMLLWMMFWLHSKSTATSWNRYISSASRKALAANSLFSLALIALLAVLREGAETVLFYVGIAPAIETAQLLEGLAIGAVALIAVAVLMLAVGVRIPIRPFFLVTSGLVFFLAFKFVGMGVHSLQVSSVLTAHTATFLPSSDFFGVFPTWETAIAQLLLVVASALGWVLTSGHEPRRAAARQGARAGA